VSISDALPLEVMFSASHHRFWSRNTFH